MTKSKILDLRLLKRLRAEAPQAPRREQDSRELRSVFAARLDRIPRRG